LEKEAYPYWRVKGTPIGVHRAALGKALPYPFEKQQTIRKKEYTTSTLLTI
jgi:hypothetical protein